MLKREAEVFRATEELIAAVKSTEIYRHNVETENRVREIPGLMEQIEDWQWKIIELHEQFQGEELVREMEKFDEETASFAKQPIVREYVESADAFCRLIREIDDRIMEGIGFE